MGAETQIKIALPLPMDMVSSLVRAIGTMYPDATMSGNGSGYGAELVLNVPESNRRAKGSKKALAAAKVPADDPASEPELTGFGDGGISMTTPKEAAENLAVWAYTLLTSVDATNYVEQAAHHPETGQRLAVVACWTDRQTPHELRLAAERRADEAEARLRAIQEAEK